MPRRARSRCRRRRRARCRCRNGRRSDDGMTTAFVIAFLLAARAWASRHVRRRRRQAWRAAAASCVLADVVEAPGGLTGKSGSLSVEMGDEVDGDQGTRVAIRDSAGGMSELRIVAESRRREMEDRYG